MKKIIVLLLGLLVISSSYAQSTVENDKALTTNSTVRYKPLRIAVSIGLGLRHQFLSDLPYENEDSEVAFRFPIEVDIDYYFNDYLGCGITMSKFNVEGNIAYNGGPQTHKTSTIFIGPVFASRFFNHSKKNVFNMNFSIGYLNYKDRYFSSFHNPGQMNLGTVGVLTAFGYDIGLNKNFAIGFQFSMLLGGITKKYGEYPFYNAYGRQSLSRLNLTIGLRFNSN